MKYLYTLALAIFGFSTASAQTILQPGESGNNCKIAVEFDEIDDLTEASFTISLANPDTPISVISAYLYFDDNSIRPWGYDPVSKTYDVETNDYDKRKNPNGRVTSQALNAMLCDDSNPDYPGYFMVTVAGSDAFLGEDGLIATVYFDASQLSQGIHHLYMKNPYCGWVIGETVEEMSSIQYNCVDQQIDFNVNGGTITIVDGINSIYPPYPTPQVYDLSGRATNPASHGIYIVNGKKILK